MLTSIDYWMFGFVWLVLLVWFLAFNYIAF
jgi:hypothetical protein